jgi:3-hydroxybutyryl-CoA dehydrogenase
MVFDITSGLLLLIKYQEKKFMNILVVGQESDLTECRQKFGDRHEYARDESRMDSPFWAVCDTVFDFLNDPAPRRLEMYSHKPKRVVFFNTAEESLGHLNSTATIPMTWYQFGFAGLPTFLNRDILEASLQHPGDGDKLTALCQELNTSVQVVEDRVGLVTPRVICMIINEAYFAVEEGTANRADIDKAMKLGTNYPFGPFEWCARIGIRRVYRLLTAMGKDTRNDRYSICPLLEQEYRATI